MAFPQDLAEDLRAADAAAFTGKLGVDNLFWQNLGFAFQLHGDPRSTGTLVFPLVLNPKSYRRRFPFATEKTPLQDGGVHVESQGIVMGEIQIAGNFGFFPKSVSGVAVPLSGHAHWIRLQDQCFVRYSELKKDPSVSANVFLTWHALGDNEHYIVEPRSVDVAQDSSRSRFTPDYDISCDILGVAEALNLKAPEDDPVLVAVADFRASMVKALGVVEGALADIQNTNPQVFGAIREVQTVGDELLAAVGAIDEAVVGVQLVAAAAGEFLRGVKRAIFIPIETVKLLDDTFSQIAGTLARAENIPADVVQSYRQLSDGIQGLLAYPEKFKEDYDASAQRFLLLTQGPAAASQGELDAAAAGTSTNGLKAGDSARVAAGVFPTGRTFPRYQGFIEIAVAEGDTLPLLAARYLNDARRWIDIALANELKAPYISDAGLPGTLRTGASILIPQLAATPPLPEVRSSGDPTLGASQYEALLGRDLMVARDADGLFDLVVDEASGRTDFRSVAGIANVEQAIDDICGTEKGEDPLFTQKGIPALIGTKGTFERLIEAHLAIASGVQRDPRIERVSNLHFNADGDTLAVDFNAELIQNLKTRVIGRALS